MNSDKLAPGSLILLRHGQSTSNAWGPIHRLDGCSADTVRRTAGFVERPVWLLARENLVPDVVHTSVLRRAIRTADLLLEELDRSWIPVQRTWRLNERQYGALTGRVKRLVRRAVGSRTYQALAVLLFNRQVKGGPMGDSCQFCPDRQGTCGW